MIITRSRPIVFAHAPDASRPSSNTTADWDGPLGLADLMTGDYEHAAFPSYTEVGVLLMLDDTLEIDKLLKVYRKLEEKKLRVYRRTPGARVSFANRKQRMVLKKLRKHFLRRGECT